MRSSTSSSVEHPPPAQALGSRFVWRFGTTLIVAWVIVVLEFAGVVAANRTVLASIWEVQNGGVLLAPTALLLAVPVALLAAIWMVLVEHPGRVARHAAAALIGGVGIWTAYGVSTGRHFELLERRAGFIALVAAVGYAGVFVAVPRLARLLRLRPQFVLVGSAVGIVACELVNRFVLVRLYPAFHVALAAFALGGSACAAAALDHMAPRRPRRRVSALGAAVALAILAAATFARPAAARLARFDNFRLVLSRSGPILAHAVHAAARLAPAPERRHSAEKCAGASCHDRPTEVGPVLTGRDWVIVTIDAVRADHVGAYGYARPTTPNLDRLARQGVVFEHAYCPTPHTSYSITSMMTGKYMRPLLLQGAGRDSETLATILRKYGYQTAAFYPPAVFFIDRPRFSPFEKQFFGFEYRKVEFMEGRGRIDQIRRFLAGRKPGKPFLLWLHLFSPHEPYEAHPDHDFGDRDMDRYDGEIAAADATLGQLHTLFAEQTPPPVFVVTSDHGEEFGEHGGRYHGTSVYEEQVRVPLVFWAPDVLPPHRVEGPVQTIDIVPTVLESLRIPRGPRQRGRDLGPELAGKSRVEGGQAFSETEEYTLLAVAEERLICARKLGACELFDIGRDPQQKRDQSRQRASRFEALKADLHALAVSHGRYEREGLRAEGRGWPPPILRGVAGDADAAADVAALLDDADLAIRRKAAEVLFGLKQPSTASALRLALQRDEDSEVRKWAALALTRLGEGAPLVGELLHGPSLDWKRLAALALAESGNAAGGDLLIDWWMKGGSDDYELALDLLNALTRIRARDAVWPLVQSLDSVRLRPHIARALGEIGDDSARGRLAQALSEERYQGARVALASALVRLGGEYELARPLTRFLGTPDPLAGGLGLAVQANILKHVGGPDRRHLERLRAEANLGVLVRLVIPRGGNGSGTRLIVRARAMGPEGGEIRVGLPPKSFAYNSKGERKKPRNLPIIGSTNVIRLRAARSPQYREIVADVPDTFGFRPGRSVEMLVFAERGVEIDAVAVVPRSDELPPPPPEPWAEGADAGTTENR